MTLVRKQLSLLFPSSLSSGLLAKYDPILQALMEIVGWQRLANEIFDPFTRFLLMLDRILGLDLAMNL